jgi:hypothetical protein
MATPPNQEARSVISDEDSTARAKRASAIASRGGKADLDELRQLIERARQACLDARSATGTGSTGDAR